MKVLHVNAGLEDGGGLTHIVGLLQTFASGEATLLTFAEGPVATAAQAAGIQTIVLHQKSRYGLHLLTQLRRVINDGGYDIVHTHGARANLFMSLIHRRLRARWVITVHSDPTLDFMGRGLIGRLFTQLNVHSLKKAAQVDVVTEFFYAQLAKLGVAKAKMRVLYNGINFHDQPVPRLAHRQFTAMIVARLHAVKAHQFLIQCFATLPPDTRLRIVGDGPQKTAIEAQIRELGLQKRVALLGFQSPEAIRDLQADTDLNVLTSISESFPLVLLESADAGVPVVTTAVGDVKKMVPDASMGWVVPINDQQALQTALTAAYGEWQNGTLQEKGLVFRAYARDHFSLQQLHDNVVSGYKQLGVQ